MQCLRLKGDRQKISPQRTPADNESASPTRRKRSLSSLAEAADLLKSPRHADDRGPCGPPAHTMRRCRRTGVSTSFTSVQELVVMAAHRLSVAFPQPFNSRKLARLAAFARATLQLLCDQGAHHGRKADAFTSRFAHERIVLLSFKRNLRAMHDGIYDLNQETSSYITKRYDVNIRAGWEDSIKTNKILSP
jgi:hypothetical protein